MLRYLLMNLNGIGSVNCRQEWQSLTDTVCGKYNKKGVRRRVPRRERHKIVYLSVCGRKA